MSTKRFRHCICLLLAVTQLGCRSAYELNLSSKPSGATVAIGGQVYGITPYKLEIPKDSEVIEDNCIDVVYTLPDGRTITRTYDLRDYKQPNPVLDLAAGILVLPGLLLFMLSSSDKDDEEDDQHYASPLDDDEEDDKAGRKAGLIGLALMGLGALVYCVFGGCKESNDVMVIFPDKTQ